MGDFLLDAWLSVGKLRQ